MPSAQPFALIVEDDDATRELYRNMLAGEGYAVIAVRDGLDALRVVEQQLPAVMVLDLGLPLLDGADVYRELKANPRTRSVPVVIVTGADVSPFEAANFRHFLRKPVNPEVLLALVDKARRRARTRH